VKFGAQFFRLAATDLSNHLACRHQTTLDLKVARGERAAPEFLSPNLQVIRELGLRHESEYLDSLRKQGLNVVDLQDLRDDGQAIAETISFLRQGVDVVSQAPFGSGRWFGRADVLRKVGKRSCLGNWSYEVYDCKLARETKAVTILQLALFSELLAEIQEQEPEFMYVVPPGVGFTAEAHRYSDYAAYYRYVKARIESVCSSAVEAATYPEPCAHCDICPWFRECDRERREDDHLSLVARITRLQRKQLTSWQTDTVAKLAVLPIPLERKPEHGSRESYERVREQARVQVKARTEEEPYYELLPVEERTGFSKLPAPSRGDVFVDLEGDPFAGESGRQYLFGIAASNPERKLAYERRWGLTADEEKQAFEWLVGRVMRRWNEDPAMHVYHFGAYEPGAFKRLMGKYATCEEEIDRMLRAGLLVDLHTIFKQAARAGVEEYSLKAAEVFHGFKRTTPLTESRGAMRFVEHRLELGWSGQIPDLVLNALEGYNEDDCRSTASLRNWLEGERQKLVDAGAAIARPEIGDGAAPEELDERQKRVAELAAELTRDVPTENRTAKQQGLWMLAQVLDWHRRENKASWWEGYRLRDLDEEDLAEERASLVGLHFVKRARVDRQIPVDRYTFEKQETDVRSARDVYCRGEKIGRVEAIDFNQRTVDIKKTRKTAEIHPTAVYAWDRPFEIKEHAEALFRIASWVKDNEVDAAGKYQAARDLLLRNTPRLSGDETMTARADEKTQATAIRIANALDSSVFAIQGPPGSGKTYTGARMICELVRQGKKIGITALSHKVIRNLLEEVVKAARKDGFENVRCMQRSDEEEETADIRVAGNNAEAWAALQSKTVNVVGGTSWLWTPVDAFESVDGLFIDEAGQMALADVLAVAQSTRNLVLIGDPQQLERPLKGSHPPGAEKSALEHLLGERKTIPESLGLLLPETWRLHPKICQFTSELFYDGRLASQDLTAHRVIEGHHWFSGAGLWFVPVAHAGNRNSAAEEVEAVVKIVETLLSPGVRWYEALGNSRPIRLDDILVVAPYNPQVADLSMRLPDARIGTVDKFQGQQAPVVIYCLTTSSAEDAPRGMEFLYSLNRLNVATSRAMSTVIVVGNPGLLEPDCQNPRQMRLANALCRYRELATVVEVQEAECGIGRLR
jgi:predicted RecB family nuclease